MSEIVVMDAATVLAALDALRLKLDALTAEIQQLAGSQKNADDPYRYMSLADLSRHFSTDRSTLRPLLLEGVYRGKIKTIAVGKAQKYRLSDVAAYLSR